MIFYFSGTGNTKWIAEQLSAGQADELVFIPKALKDNITEFTLMESEKVGFVFPVYSWGPPPIVMQFIRQLTLLNYHSHYTFFVCSCGDDIGLTKQVLSKALFNRGWGCDAGFSVIMPNNYVLLPGFDVDSREVQERKLADAVPMVTKVNYLIAERRSVFLCKEGRFPYIKTMWINPLFNRYPISPKKFHATDACVGCARCERACPVNNITLVERKPIWGANCTSCLACYHVCPQRAVQYGKKTEHKGHYFYVRATSYK